MQKSSPNWYCVKWAPQKRLQDCCAQKLCEDAGKLVCRKPQKQPQKYGHLLYSYVTMPTRHAVRSTATPLATNKAEKLRGICSEARSNEGKLMIMSYGIVLE